MDDGFDFRAPTPSLRRRVTGRPAKATLGGVIALIAIVVFAGWVVRSERRSDARAAEHAAAPIPATAAGDIPDPSRAVDAAARADARNALATVRSAIREADGPDAIGPAELSARAPSLTFTDGPSPAPGIVSVATRGERWAGAVMGASGTCYWVALEPGITSFGSGRACTGIAALAASDRSW